MLKYFNPISKILYIICILSDIVYTLSMAILNRNYLVNRNKAKRDKSERAGGKRKLYYSISCPNCGEPKEYSTIALNRFAQSPKSSVFCRLCRAILGG